MLLPFEFLFPRGFLRQIYLLFFPLTCFFATCELFFDEFLMQRFGTLPFGILRLCTCGLLIELLEIVTERKYFMD